MRKTIIKTIPNFPNYAISEDGKIWSDLSFKFLKPFLNDNRYFRVDLCKNKKRYRRLVHRLVLETFVGPCPLGMEACHINGNATDNHIYNLRWDTHFNNHKDRRKHGTSLEGTNHPMVKLSEQDVRMIIYMQRTKEFTQVEIAKLYNITPTNVGHIIKKKSWKHIWNRR